MDGMGGRVGKRFRDSFFCDNDGDKGNETKKKRRHSPRTRPTRVPRTAYPIPLSIFALTHHQRKRPTLVDSTLSCHVFVVAFGIPPHFFILGPCEKLTFGPNREGPRKQIAVM